MGLIDIILLSIVGAFVLFGFFFGLVHTLGSLIGSIIGIYFTTRLIDPVFERFGFIFGGGNFGRIILFIILFFLIARLVGLVFWLLGIVWDLLSFIPFAKSLDKIFGAMFGLVEGIIVVGVVVFYSTQVLPEDTLLAAINTSAVAKYLLALVSIMQVFLPEGLKAVKEVAKEQLPV